MSETNKSYRIHTQVSEEPSVINVQLNQTYDMFEILSLKLDQKNSYKYYESDYGVIVGRVVANGNFGVPNAKVSVFIEVNDDETMKNRLIYNFTSVQDVDNDGVRYNTLPDYVDNACHQDVGTFPNKRLVLDNDDVLEMFDKYWKYTTTTNESGDYMLYGIPSGNQKLHVDIDLSDIGVLSQRPRDMVYKGYNITQFESPNKFKESTNLNSLAQIYSQDKGLYVYPYWGETSENEDNIAITRCDIQLEYKFEPTAIFIGSIVTDKGSNAIGKNCTGTEEVGKMSDLSASEGSIEMIRKTLDNKVEEFQIKGNRLIDGDGVWCYQIPMNLDYVMTDEFGNIVPTDDPSKGIPTRTRVRFRISVDESPNDATARKRCKYLVPNNPRMSDVGFKETLEADYEFGTNTREESYRDLFWNKVYTVKNYIPRLQKNNKITNRKHTGIKLINYYGDNNPFPYNSLTIKLTFTYRLICVITKIFIKLIGFLNNLISILGYLPCWLGSKCLKIWKFKICPFSFLLKLIPGCIELSSDFCDDGINPNIYYPGCGKPFDCVWTKKTRPDCQKEQASKPKEEQMICTNSSSELYTCVETQLAESNDATSCNFNNDWVNGVLYAPLWYRKKTPKKSFLFGLFKKRAKDEWCSSDKQFGSLRIFQPCAVDRTDNYDNYDNFDGYPVSAYRMSRENCGSKCHERTKSVGMTNGVIVTRQTMLGQTVYYYKSVEYDDTLSDDYGQAKKGNVKLLFATDIVLLGSLNDCDLHGIPQFFKSLEASTFNLPTSILFTDHEIINQFDAQGNLVETQYTENTEMTGRDWGNKNEFGKHDSGLFYSIGCSTIEMTDKSCINLNRICEYGVSLDETKAVADLNKLSGDDNAYDELIADSFVSYDELYNLDERSMFATMNGNKLKTKLNKQNGLLEYDFRYLYPENFDGSLYQVMRDTTNGYSSDVNYKFNYNLETPSRDYYIFRMGNKPYYYGNDRRLPRYENSFYFYFGLKNGKTAIEKFNSQFFAPCESIDSETFKVGIVSQANSWCSEVNGVNDGYLKIDVTGISTPFNMIVNGISDSTYGQNYENIVDEKICFVTDNTILTTLTNENYVKVDEMMNNGEYEITITDADGNISTSMVNIKGKYLTYKVAKTDFSQPNNVLLEDFNNSYAAIADDDKNNVTINPENETIRDIGGTITIYDIYYNNQPLTNDFRITIEPLDEIGGGYMPPISINGNSTNGNGLLKMDKTNGVYSFGLPKGDVKYKIVVTQLCNGVDSKNFVSNIVLVSEPIPYKLYINDIDYDVIKNFVSGWTISGNTNSFSIQRNGNVSGWLNISDKNNGLYDWESNEIFTKDYYDGTDEEKETLVEQAKDEFITAMKNTFYLTCPNDSKTINISVRTSDFPFSSAMIYRDEMISEEDEEKHVLNGCDNVLTTETNITDILIPTITNKDDEQFGTTEANYIIEGDICFAKDNTLKCGGSKNYKNPYFVAVVNGKGKTLPSKDVGVTGDDTNGYQLSGNVKGYFAFHLIDKRFKMNMLAWSYINNIPYYNPGNGDKIGKSINMSGLLAANIFNGNITTEDVDDTIYYETQSFGITSLKIKRYKDSNEDSIPTKRVIIGENTGNNIMAYKNYRLTDQVVDLPQYASVLNAQMSLTLEDTSGCSIEETVFGSMKINLNDESLNDLKNGTKTLSVRASNVDSSEDVYYYIYCIKNGKAYPLNDIELDTTIEMNPTDEPIVNLSWDNDDGKVFSFATSTDVLKSLVFDDAKSQIPNDEDPLLMEDSNGYGTTGKFEIGNNNNQYYIIAVTSNNCRTISPVYDFDDIQVEIGIQEQITRTTNSVEVDVNVDVDVNVSVETPPATDDEGNESGGGTGTGSGSGSGSGTGTGDVVTETIIYKLGVKVKKGYYYFDNYPYTAQISIKFDDGIIGGSVRFDPTTSEDEYAFFEITKNQCDAIKAQMDLPFFGDSLIAQRSEVLLTDYTGLKHLCGVNQVNEVQPNPLIIEIDNTTEPEPASANWLIIKQECELDAYGNNTGNLIITEEDDEPLSATYGQTRTNTFYDVDFCPLPSTEPNWVVESQTCEVDENDENTGNLITVERDTNQKSSTYNETRTTTVYDIDSCPLPDEPPIVVIDFNDTSQTLQMMMDYYCLSNVETSATSYIHDNSTALDKTFNYSIHQSIPDGSEILVTYEDVANSIKLRFEPCDAISYIKSYNPSTLNTIEEIVGGYGEPQYINTRDNDYLGVEIMFTNGHKVNMLFDRTFLS